MLVAGTRGEPQRCRFVRGQAEELPFTGLNFDRALMQTSVHLMRRPEAFAEARRVLVEDGWLTIFTVDPAGVDDFWLAEWFPSYPAIDRRRFPDEPTLRRELSAAHFARIEVRRHTRELHFTRDRALAMLRARFASSFALMTNEEFHAGIERAERDMPEAFVAQLQLLILAAGSACRETG